MTVRGEASRRDTNVENRDRFVDRQTRKAMQSAPSALRLDIARAAFEEVVRELPMDSPVVRQYLRYFTSGEPVPQNDELEAEVGDDPLEIVSVQFWTQWVQTGSDKDYRRYQAVDALTWAVMLADGDPEVSYRAADETVYRTLLTFAEDPERREAVLSIVQKRLGVI